MKKIVCYIKENNETSRECFHTLALTHTQRTTYKTKIKSKETEKLNNRKNQKFLEKEREMAEMKNKIKSVKRMMRNETRMAGRM